MNPIQIITDTWNLQLMPGGVDAESMLIWHVWLVFVLIICIALIIVGGVGIVSEADSE